MEGYNYRLDTIQAGILNIKLKHLDENNDFRRNHAEYYDKHLSCVKPIKMRKGSVYHQYVIRSEKRDKLRLYLKENGISTGIHYPLPLHLQPAYSRLKHNEGDFPIAERLSKEILSKSEYFFKTALPEYYEKYINEMNAPTLSVEVNVTV